MRKTLQTPYERVYRLSERDFDRTLDLCARLARSHRAAETASVLALRDDASQAAVEIISDVHFYAVRDSLYVWHYGLLRCHAIFEALIAERFLANLPHIPRGMTGKLEKLEQLGLRVSPANKAELDLWYRLRNELAHDVPDHIHGSRLTGPDIEEFANLLKRIIRDWADQQDDGREPSPSNEP